MDDEINPLYFCFFRHWSKYHLTLIGMSSENKKKAHIWRQIGPFFVRLNETRLMPISTSKKVWKYLIKIQLTKRQGGGKCPASCQLGFKSPVHENGCLLKSISWQKFSKRIFLLLKFFFCLNFKLQFLIDSTGAT